MQEASTADMVFGVPEIVSYLSECFTLEPGDVIATGTPGGVGHFRNPPVYLKPGDRIRIEIERIGTLENPVRSES
jgi:2-keto-4-pentenoate hydratase/2-oxohepta-3-ene-1,7-dioic acid hydratase in catechol pathway